MWNSLTQYHPRVGFTLMPNVKSRIPWETGGYLVRTNSAGFRSEREFAKERTPGKFRAILFGDSQTAGDGSSNPDRYSDVVEKLVPDVEIYNYGLPISSTDQHYLVYQESMDVEHDLVIIGIHVENIGRIAHRYLPSHDSQGRPMAFAKPYFNLEDGKLTLHHVPVPKAPLPWDAIPPELSEYVYDGVPHATLRAVVRGLGLQDLVQKVVRFQPVPDYDSPDNPRWLLLRKILEEWIRASQVPVLLLPLPMWSFVQQSSDPTSYQTRFRELAADTGCHLHDPLPDLWRYSDGERKEFRFNKDPHFTRAGHAALAKSLAPVLERIRAESAAPQAH